MDAKSPTLSLEMDRPDDQSCERPPLPPSDHAGVGGVRSLSLEDQRSFRVRLERLLTTFEITDTKRDVPMRSFLKWRMQVVWFLHRHLGGKHPFTVEFVSTVEREADPHSNGRFVIAGQAILEALLSDFDEGQIFVNNE
jgi:hypothetical protein